ncbi:MAG: dihydroorotase family protein [Candidatus Cloacimonadaceae bacterium]
MKKLLTNGLVWQETGFVKQDILIEDGRIISLGENLFELFLETFDCSGSFIFPAICDMHVHVGERVCGLDLADNWQSLSKLSEVCGIAGIGAFLTERSEFDNSKKSLLQQYEIAQTKAAKDFKQQVHWHLTPTLSEVQEIMPLLKAGCDLKFYTTYKPNGLYRSYAEIARWMQDLSDLKPRILVHCEDDEKVNLYSDLHPFQHPFDHTKRRPEQAEIKAVEKILDLAVQYNYPVHIVHVSAPQSAFLIKQAKKSAPVTCETAPHYLLLDETCLQKENGHRWLCTPPLRNEQSRGQLVELLQEGVFDAIATDHCPFTLTDKDKHKDNLERFPMGFAGLGATFPLLYEYLVKTGKLPLEKLIPLISTNPAKLMNLYPKLGNIQPGAPAKLIILKAEPLQKPVQVLASLSKAPNPWQDFSHTIDYTFFEDEYDTH